MNTHLPRIKRTECALLRPSPPPRELTHAPAPVDAHYENPHTGRAQTEKKSLQLRDCLTTRRYIAQA